ncbi:MAG: hybrid sensor histidine kinase/response regulator [Polyangiales bacterium]
MRRVVLVGRSPAIDRIAEAAAAESLEIVGIACDEERAWSAEDVVVLDCDRSVESARSLAGKVASIIAFAHDDEHCDALLEAGADDCFLVMPTRAIARARLRRTFARVETFAERREELRLVLGAARICTWDWDVVQGTVRWSESASEIFGLEPRRGGETIGSLLRLVHVDDRQRVEAAFARALASSGDTLEIDYRLAVPERSLRWVHTRALVFRDESGKPLRVRSAVVDDTDRKLAEIELRRAYDELTESEERFRVVARATSDCVWDWDLPSSEITWNDSFAQLFGYAQTRTPLSFWEQAIHPDDRGRVKEGLESFLLLGEDHWSDEYLFRRANGTYAAVLDRGVVIRDEQGKPARMIGSMMDLTERRELQARLALADRMASVGTLAAGVAHEINNPLAYVVTNLDAAANEIARLAPGSRALQALAEAKEGSERVRRIVQDLKTFSRADDDSRERVDLKSVVVSSLDLAMNEIRHRARLVRDLRDAPRVDANAGKLGQVVVNLLVNAAQAIPEGAVDKHEIRVVTRTDDDGHAVLEVADTGPGMPPEIRRRIFDPFYTTKPVGEGTGLGLTICHGIVTALGGSIEVESMVGAGSTFRVTLPPSTVSERASRPSAVPPSTETERRGRVLVVDDEPLIGKSVQLLLSTKHDVVPLTSAREAYDRMLSGERWDAVLCDLMMPEMTGMDLYERLEQRMPELARKMVFLTGGAFTPRARAFLERGQNPRVEKPFDEETLLAAIASVMRATSS